MINIQSWLDCFQIVIRTAWNLATFQQTFDQFIFVCLKVQHNGNICSTFIQHFFQSFCLRDRTRETVEDDAFGVHLAVQNLGQHVNDQFVRNQLSLFDVIFSNLTQLCLVLHFRTQNITCRNMVQTIFFNNQFALCSLSWAGSTKNNNVQHKK